MNAKPNVLECDPQAEGDVIEEQGQATKLTQGRITGYLTESSPWPWRF